ncbi:MAG: radical SAM protein [Deltaproteobacteria bacterium]|nr:radical SAM protein [Deltaproteobacteria bacterium]
MVSLPRAAQQLPDESPALPPLARLLQAVSPARRALLLRLHESVAGDGARGTVAAGLLRNLDDNPAFVAWLQRLATELGDRPLEVFLRDLIVKHAVEGHRRRLACLERHGFFGPHTVVINPTMKCNLRCAGCYAAGFARGPHMDYDLLRKVLGEARELGVHFVTVSGGEPFLYPHLERMAEEFDDVVFMVYTNATLLDAERVARLERLGNLWPAISVEGFAGETDRRRGPGVYDAVLRAMRLLRAAGVMFGFSATPTRENGDLLADDGFLDHWLERGVLFGWMFQYLPLGRDPDVDLMATPAQRDRLRAATRRWGLTRPIFVGDFWNDGACVGGCLSASKYCYVATDGAVQPCTFVPFATHNVRDHSLVEVFTSPLFRAIRAAQPYDPNLLRSCKIIDRPECLRAIVATTGARPTYPGADAIVRHPAVTAHLDRYAREWARLSDAAWRTDSYREGRSVVMPFLGRIDVNDLWPERMARAGTRSLHPTAQNHD